MIKNFSRWKETLNKTQEIEMQKSAFDSAGR